MPRELTTRELVLPFRELSVIPKIGDPVTLVCDSNTCFPSSILQAYMSQHGTKWQTVLAYAFMSNETAQRMVETTKCGIDLLVIMCSVKWENGVDKILFEYCRRPLRGGSSPFQLHFAVKSKILPSDLGAKSGLAQLNTVECTCWVSLNRNSSSGRAGAQSSSDNKGNEETLGLWLGVRCEWKLWQRLKTVYVYGKRLCTMQGAGVQSFMIYTHMKYWRMLAGRDLCEKAIDL